MPVPEKSRRMGLTLRNKRLAGFAEPRGEAASRFKMFVIADALC
jgi:hypothetical protein